MTGPSTPSTGGAYVSTQHAITDTLDNFISRQGIERLDLIKMDVDGHELPILRGAEAILRRFQPIFIMEMSPYIHTEAHHIFGDFVNF